MTASPSRSAGLVTRRRKGSKRVHSAPVDRVAHDDAGAAWLGAPVVPALLILDGGTAFRSQKGLQVASDLAATADD
jgi:hypothetical protein